MNYQLTENTKNTIATWFKALIVSGLVAGGGLFITADRWIGDKVDAAMENIVEKVDSSMEKMNNRLNIESTALQTKLTNIALLVNDNTERNLKLKDEHTESLQTITELRVTAENLDKTVDRLNIKVDKLLENQSHSHE